MPNQNEAGLRLLIVIVNYRSVQLTLQCLRSLEAEVPRVGNCRVVVVENASGEAEQLQAAINQQGWSQWCRLMELTENRGFAAGNNAAIALALQTDSADETVASSSPQYILLLNPDTVVLPGAVQRLACFLDDQRDVGIVGSRLEWEDGQGQRAARRFPSVASELESTVRLGPVSRLLANRTIAPQDPTETTATDWVVSSG